MRLFELQEIRPCSLDKFECYYIPNNFSASSTARIMREFLSRNRRSSRASMAAGDRLFARA